MRLRKWILFLSVFALLCSMALPVQAAERAVRKRESYSYFTDEQLTQMLSLDETQLASLKADIREAIMTQTDCDVQPYALPFGNQDVVDALCGLIYLHPEFFFIDYFSYSINLAANQIVSLSFFYQDSFEVCMQKYEAFVEAAEALLAPIRAVPSLSDLEKALLVHDTLAIRCAYDLNNMNNPDRYTPYGALVKQKSACQGYAESYAYMLMQLGIPCGLCKSDFMNHAWNIVEIGGKEYHVDVTWDDPTVDLSGRVRHESFLCSTQRLLLNGYVAPDMTATPANTEFDSGLWRKINSAFCLCDGEIFCLSSGKLCRFDDGKLTALCEFPDWNGYYNFLASDGEDLYLSSFYTVYRYNAAANKWEKAYDLDLKTYKGYRIYGFAIEGDEFVLDINTSSVMPHNLKDYQIRYRYRKALQEPDVPETPVAPDAPCDGGEGCDCRQFTDVAGPNDWTHKGIGFAIRNGLFSGMSATTFEPNTAMTRAMLVTVLWRYAGKPVEGQNSFTDIANGQWYTDAVTWAAENGIVAGVGNGRFDPEGKITREQMATILYRYAAKVGIDTGKSNDLSFPDAGKVSGYATGALQWAVAEGLVSGSKENGVTYLHPQGNATRAQVASILMRFIENVAG